MAQDSVVVVGAGVAGLVAALSLARAGFAVTLCEATGEPGGKMGRVWSDRLAIDCGPTVLTMVPVLDEILRPLGIDLDSDLRIARLETLSRNWWHDGPALDLYADHARTVAAVGDFAGSAAARGYERFCTDAANIYRTLEHTFIRATRPSVAGLVARIGFKHLGATLAINPFESLWRALGRYFADPRLRQLFGRYATYMGSSPFAAPATLMLIAHVEQQGVWTVDGGIHELARVLADTAMRAGVELRYATKVAQVLTDRHGVSGVVLADGDRIETRRVVFNGDVAALATGCLGDDMRKACRSPVIADRSLSAVTFAGAMATDGAALDRHNVFFSADYQAEFAGLARGTMPNDPTIYLCAGDRPQTTPAGRPERLFALINAPALGDRRARQAWESDKWLKVVAARLERSGVRLCNSLERMVATTPTDFADRYPATGGALYGRASRGWSATFSRPDGRGRIPGLYLAGGSTHPGPGVPMAAIAGWLAASSLQADWISQHRWRPAPTAGGMSTA